MDKECKECDAFKLDICRFIKEGVYPYCEDCTKASGNISYPYSKTKAYSKIVEKE
jgi:hypothetical protein